MKLLSGGQSSSRAVSRSVGVVVVILILLVAAVAIYYGTVVVTKSSTTSSSSTTFSSTSSTSVSSTSSSTTFTLVPSNTLTIDEAFYPSYGLNFLLPGLSFPNYMFETVYQTLLTYNVTAEYNNQGYQLLPDLATNYTVSSSGLTYTLNLRQGVTFSNGDPFNAYDVWTQLYGMYHMLFNYSMFGASTLGIVGALGPSLTLINMSSVEFGEAQITTLQSANFTNPSQSVLSLMMNQAWPVYVTGPYQIVFRLQHPYSYFPDIFAGVALIQYDAQLPLKAGFPLYGTPAFGAFETEIIPGTGPYMITGFTPNGYISYTQNPTYWGLSLTAAQIQSNPFLDPGHVKNVIINYKPDDLSRYTDLADNVAQISMIESEDWPLISSNPSTYGYSTLPSNANIFFVLSMNTVRYPTNITDVRLAIAHAINYTLIDTEILHNQLSQFFGPETPGFGPLYDVGNYSQYSYNVTLAQQYLKDANIKNFPTIYWSMPSGFTAVSSVAQVVQSELLANLGISVQIQVYTYSQYIAPYNQGYAYNVANPNNTAQLTIMGGQDYGQLTETPIDDWITFATPVGTDTGTWWAPPDIYGLLTAFLNGSSIAQIQSLEGQVESEFYNQAPFIWLGIPKLMVVDGSLAYKTSIIKGFYIDPDWTGANMGPVFNTVTFSG